VAGDRTTAWSLDRSRLQEPNDFDLIVEAMKRPKRVLVGPNSALAAGESQK